VVETAARRPAGLWKRCRYLQENGREHLSDCGDCASNDDCNQRADQGILNRRYAILVVDELFCAADQIVHSVLSLNMKSRKRPSLALPEIHRLSGQPYKHPCKAFNSTNALPESETVEPLTKRKKKQIETGSRLRPALAASRKRVLIGAVTIVVTLHANCMRVFFEVERRLLIGELVG
jgi:hypothetical protein